MLIYGNRFFGDQGAIDLLSEFLLVAVSPKKVDAEKFDDFVPKTEVLRGMAAESSQLQYAPRSGLNIKLFAFLNSTRLEARHESHRRHAANLHEKLKSSLEMLDSDDESSKNELIVTLSNLLLGFWGSGSQRAWCAQSFIPFCKGAILDETIWNQTQARKQSDLRDWDEVLASFSTYFSQNKHVVNCRGGELLYLQMCSALSHTEDEVREWLSSFDDSYVGLTDEERIPDKLRDKLERGFARFLKQTPRTLDQIIDFIDKRLDGGKTSKKSDCLPTEDFFNDRRYAMTSWTPADGWHENYLFAVELSRILSLNIGPMEEVDLLKMCCVLQEMRSLATQSYRHSETPGGRADGRDYRLLICDNTGREVKTRRLSIESHAQISLEIRNAIRTTALEEYVDRICPSAQKREKAFSQADSSYGFKLYRKVGKGIGLIIPLKGGKMRFTLNDKILRYLVLSLLPSSRMTLDAFKRQMEFFHGIVVDPARLVASRNWALRTNELQGDFHNEEYLERMLEAAGVLVRLSDSCSLVKNPYVK